MKKIKPVLEYFDTDEEFRQRKKEHFKLIHQEVIKADALTLVPLVAYLLKNSRLDVRQYYKRLSFEALAEIELINRFPVIRKRSK